MKPANAGTYRGQGATFDGGTSAGGGSGAGRVLGAVTDRAPESRICIAIRVALKTTNPNNGAMGNTRVAAIIKSQRRKKERALVREAVMLHLRKAGFRSAEPLFPVLVTVTRVAPSSGLDVWDGLGAALKSSIDGTADALGLTNDRDERVKWVPAQRRGTKGEYAVEIRIEEAVHV